MAKEIQGVFYCMTGFCLPVNNGNDILLYPEGRHLRGAAGYIALNYNLPIAEYFPDFNWDGVIFRDMLPFSKCKKLYKMGYDGVLESCSECGDSYGKNMIYHSKNQKLFYTGIREGRRYRCSIIVQDETYLPDIKIILEHMRNVGIYIGKRINSGNGKFILQGYSISETMPITASVGMLLSDAVMANGKKRFVIGKTVQDKYEKIDITVIPRGSTVTNINGFYVGKFGGLGFGEIRV